MKNWQGKNVLVIGAARQGLSATRFLSNRGAHVILTDGRDPSYFTDVIASFADSRVDFSFGSHPLSLLDHQDAVCVSGGVPLDIPLVENAIERDIPLTNDAQIFLEQSKAGVIGITGSAGKTTTTTLIGEMAKATVKPPQKAWVGGNIGNPLIDHVDAIAANDWVVMELSSFQLELMDRSPDIALVLNITLNHLDRHKTMEAYTNAKANIINHQSHTSISILNREDRGSFALRNQVNGILFTFGFEKPQADFSGTFIQDGMLQWSQEDLATPVMPVTEINLPGRHNLANALAASAAGLAAGFPIESIRTGIKNVYAIPHRLELVVDRKNIHWINDSIATAPERVIAALEAIPGPLVLLLGGRDKDLPWDNLAKMVTERKPKLILFGEAGEMIENVLRRESFCGETAEIHRFVDLEDAVRWAAKIAQTGDTVLLSPGGTSYDAFKDFEERGELFKELVKEIA